jgi:hypothetical protein
MWGSAGVMTESAAMLPSSINAAACSAETESIAVPSGSASVVGRNIRFPFLLK